MDDEDGGAAARAIEILGDLVGFDSVSSKSNVALMIYIRDLLANCDVAAHLLPDETGEKANLFAAIGPSRSGGVILSGHSDVVPVTGQNWSSDPFILTRRGDRLYGRGTADMKAFLACALAAIEQLRPDALKRPVYLAFTHDEEVGCRGAPPLIAHIAATIPPPAAVIVGEPSRMRIIGSHKSVHIFTVEVTGIAAHSSAVHQGISANLIAIRLMHVLIETGERLTGVDLRDTVFEPPHATLTIGQMSGGTAANILAAQASFVFDLRCLPGQDAAEILRPFFAEVAAMRSAYPRAAIVVEAVAAVPPLAHVEDGAAERIARAASGDNANVLTAAYGAEAGQFQKAGFPVVICGPGSMDQGHQPDEYIEIAEIEKCMRFLRTLFTHLSHPAAAV